MHWVIRPWRHIFDFNGRSPRREYWLFQLQMIILWFAGAMLLGAAVRAFNSPFVAAPGVIVELVLICVLIVANLAVAVRRLHDHDKSGWLYLLAFVPLLGWVFILIMMLTPGAEGENSYGYDPRDGDEPPVEDVAAVFS